MQIELSLTPLAEKIYPTPATLGMTVMTDAGYVFFGLGEGQDDYSNPVDIRNLGKVVARITYFDEDDGLGSGSRRYARIADDLNWQGKSMAGYIQGLLDGPNRGRENILFQPRGNQLVYLRRDDELGIPEWFKPLIIE